MNVTRLRIVYELSRRGSVTAVAEALWTMPSAIAQLRREVAELFEDPLVVVLPNGHRLASSDEVLWSELADEAFIVEPRASLFAHAVASAP